MFARITYVVLLFCASGFSGTHAGKSIAPILSLLLDDRPAISLCQAELLADLNGESTGSYRVNPQFTELGNQTFFMADHPTFGTELWVSDGTPQGSHLFLDINPGSADGIFGAGALTDRMFIRVGSAIYFLADDGTHGEELWRTDGTLAGTFMVKDIDVGEFSSHINNMTAYNGKVYFLASSISDDEGLWVSDGTAAGTQLIKEMLVDSTTNAMAVLDNKLIYRAIGVGSDNGTGTEIWVSDGTSGGTQLLKDINPNSSSSFPSNFAVVDNQLFFIADDGLSGDELWVTDGTGIGTHLVKDINPGTADGVFDLNIKFNFKKNTGFNGKLYFPAKTPQAGTELWESDGTNSGTRLIKDIVPGTTSGLPEFESAALFNNHFYFLADDDDHGEELWKIAANGVVTLAKDLDPGDSHSSPEFLTSNGDFLFFSAGIQFSVGTEPTILDKQGRIRQIDTLPGSASFHPNYFHVRDDKSVIFTQANGFTSIGVGLYQIECPDPAEEN